jgi:hypothetical protein
VQPQPNEPFFWWKSAPGFINLVVAWVQHQTAGSALLESPTVLQKKQ